MSVLDDVLFNAKVAVNEVGKKANTIVDTTKLKFNASELRGALKKKYEELGALVYSNAKVQEDDEVVKCIAEIDEINNQLKSIEDTVQTTVGKRKCPACEAINPKDSVFCNRCGTKIVGVDNNTQK